ncbi:MAG: TPM domain-containing protein [Lachnospiraceae bacterium]|nr:TPM domain-containing protein [Lachnospiraceae bacterium]
MKNRKKSLTGKLGAILILTLIILFLPLPIYAEIRGIVQDDAELLLQEDASRLEDEVEGAVEATGWNIALVTTNETNGRSSEEYADDFYDGQFGINTDGIALLIDMQNRRVHISTSGDAIKIVSDRDVEAIIDAGYDELRDGEYARCFHKMLKKAVGIKEDSIPHISATEAVVAIAAAGLTFLFTLLGVRKKYKAIGQAYRYNYSQNSKASISTKVDQFLHESVHKVRIVRNEGGGGGGGSSTHISSSGGTHGGGGRSF